MWVLGCLGTLAEAGDAGNSWPVEARETFQEVLVLTRRNKASARAGQTAGVGASLVPVREGITDVDGNGANVD